MASRAEIDRDWSADDVLAAHLMLDALDDADRRAVANARSAAERKRPR